MLRKILVPVDSIKWDNTLRGVESAMDYAKGWENPEEKPELFFLHVFHSNSRVPTDKNSRRHRMKEEKIKEEFEEIEGMCEDRDLEKVETVIRKGEPHEEIVKMAKEKDVDLIVMGSGKLHDRSTQGKIHKFVYGSVTERVIHKAPCSILVARPDGFVGEKDDEGRKI